MNSPARAASPRAATSSSTPQLPSVGAVQGDAIEPGKELPRFIESADLPVERQKSVLRGLLGILRVAQDPVSQRINASVIPAHHLLESPIVPRPDAADKIDVRGGFIDHGYLRLEDISRFIPSRSFVSYELCVGPTKLTTHNPQPTTLFHWRRGGDSNPRYLLGTHAFQACSLSHSDTSPGRQRI